MLLIALGIAVCNLAALGMFLNHAHSMQKQQQQHNQRGSDQVHTTVQITVADDGNLVTVKTATEGAQANARKALGKEGAAHTAGAMPSRLAQPEQHQHHEDAGRLQHSSAATDMAESGAVRQRPSHAAGDPHASDKLTSHKPGTHGQGQGQQGQATAESTGGKQHAAGTARVGRDQSGLDLMVSKVEWVDPLDAETAEMAETAAQGNREGEKRREAAQQQAAASGAEGGTIKQQAIDGGDDEGTITTRLHGGHTYHALSKKSGQVGLKYSQINLWPGGA